jgi:phospholipid transport system substrate-binding protein
MSSPHRIGPGYLGLPLRELRGREALGSLALWLICVATILLGATNFPEANPSPAPGTPTEAMRTTVSQALGVLQDPELKKPEGTHERVARLKKIAEVRFDYGEMAKRSLGGQWNKLAEREQQEFVVLFTEFLTATYVDKLHTYTGEEMTFLNERLEGDHAEVTSIMVGKKTKIPMDYRLMKKGGNWKVYDVVIDGVSLIQNYRGQFAAILRSSSYEHLVQVLREKIAQYNVKPKSADTRTSSR